MGSFAVPVQNKLKKDQKAKVAEFRSVAGSRIRCTPLANVPAFVLVQCMSLALSCIEGGASCTALRAHLLFAQALLQAAWASPCLAQLFNTSLLQLAPFMHMHCPAVESHLRPTPLGMECSNANAIEYLKAENWNLETAIDRFFNAEPEAPSDDDVQVVDAGPDAFFDKYKSAPNSHCCC